jgi:hypothetical protein
MRLPFSALLVVGLVASVAAVPVELAGAGGEVEAGDTWSNAGTPAIAGRPSPAVQRVEESVVEQQKADTANLAGAGTLDEPVAVVPVADAAAEAVLPASAAVADVVSAKDTTPGDGSEAASGGAVAP